MDAVYLVEYVSMTMLPDIVVNSRIELTDIPKGEDAQAVVATDRFVWVGKRNTIQRSNACRSNKLTAIFKAFGIGDIQSCYFRSARDVGV